MRTAIYIDGFNFYYRAVRGTPYKWLDVKKVCQRLLRPEHQIVAIKYYTAPVSGKRDPGQPIRQQTYLRALRATIPELVVHNGHFLTHEVSVPLAHPAPGSPSSVRVLKTEEKGSDVNLAVHMLNDAWLDAYLFCFGPVLHQDVPNVSCRGYEVAPVVMVEERDNLHVTERLVVEGDPPE
jgi:hypothetical protein